MRPIKSASKVSTVTCEVKDLVAATPISGPRGRMYGFAEAQEPFSPGIDENLTKRETLELVRAYYRITDPAVRKRMFDLMKSLAPTETPFET